MAKKSPFSMFYFLAGFCATLCLPTLPSYAQNTQLAVEFTPTGEMGWWVYDRGVDSIHRGYDRTSLAFIGGWESRLYLSLGERWKLSGEYTFRMLVDHDMTLAESPRGNNLEYDISVGNTVNLTRIGLGTEYKLVTRNRYTFSPYLTAGIFGIKTIHPEASNFGAKTWWEVGVSHIFQLNKGLFFTIKPRYNTMTIRVKTPEFPGEVHKIYGFGLGFGLRFLLF